MVMGFYRESMYCKLWFMRLVDRACQSLRLDGFESDDVVLVDGLGDEACGDHLLNKMTQVLIRSRMAQWRGQAVVDDHEIALEQSRVWQFGHRIDQIGLEPGQDIGLALLEHIH
jgi:hypothetical protein